MKKYVKSAMFATLLAFTLIFIACQQESSEEFITSENDTLTIDSDALNLMASVVSNDGSFDNIIDNSSCFDIQFPYTVSVNELEITINSIDDLRVIEEILDALDSDNDILDIVFPITITLADYSEISITDAAELRAYASKCIEGGDDDDIECIDVIYPVTFFTYDTEVEQTGTVNVGSDKEMSKFFASLGVEDVISIQFPVTFEMFDGEKINAVNVDDLKTIIKTAKQACDEDDDDDFNDDDFSKESLDMYLISCSSVIQEIKRNDQAQTDQYFQYVMNFTDNGVVVTKDREGNAIVGDWSTSISQNRVLLKLAFAELADFSLDWFVYEIKEGKIKLFADGGNEIIIQKNCEGDEADNNCNLSGEFEAIAEISSIQKLLPNTIETPWQVAQFTIGSQDIAANYDGHNFVFRVDTGTIISEIYKPGNTQLNNYDGSSPWYFQDDATDGNARVLMYYAEDQGSEVYSPFNQINKYSVVKGASNERIELKTCSGNNEEIVLVFEKQKSEETNCNLSGEFEAIAEISSIQNLLPNTIETPWKVAQFTIGSQDIAANYDGHNFVFRVDTGTIISEIYKPGNTQLNNYDGSSPWYFQDDATDGNARVLMYYAEDQGNEVYSPFNQINRYSVVKGASSERIELKTCSGNNEEIVLVFEKQNSEENNCNLSGEFEAIADISLIQDLLPNTFETPWQIAQFIIGSQDITTNYDGHNFVFRVDTGTVISEVYKPGNTQLNNYDGSSPWYFQDDASDGNARILMYYAEDQGNEVYSPFNQINRYSVVKGASSERIELKTCTDNNEEVVLVFEKK